MVSVPVAMPVTIPELFTVAMEALVELQAPPPELPVKEIVALMHTLPPPEIVPALGNGWTANICVAVAVPQLFTTA